MIIFSNNNNKKISFNRGRCFCMFPFPSTHGFRHGRCVAGTWAPHRCTSAGAGVDGHRRGITVRRPRRHGKYRVFTAVFSAVLDFPLFLLFCFSFFFSFPRQRREAATLSRPPPRRYLPFSSVHAYSNPFVCHVSSSRSVSLARPSPPTPETPSRHSY